MKNEMIFFKKCEIYFLDKLESIFDEFPSEISSKIIFDSPDLSWIDITINNKINQKIIRCLISIGKNVDNDQFLSLNFEFEKYVNEEKISSFTLKDYSNYLDTDFNIREFFIDNDFETYSEKFENYINRVISNVSIIFLKKILNSDFWINIKPDFSPYK